MDGVNGGGGTICAGQHSCTGDIGRATYGAGAGETRT